MGLKVCENQEFLLVQIATQLSIISDYSFLTTSSRMPEAVAT